MGGVDITRDQVLDAMVSALSAVTAGAGLPLSPTRFLRTAQRYMGEEWKTAQEGQERGLAGRTPAARIGFLGERKLSTTIGRRRDKVEGTYGVWMATDVQRSRDSRSVLFSAMQGVRDLMGARAFSLGIKPMQYMATQLVHDDDKLLVYLDSYTTRYRIDYTKDPGTDLMLDISGSIVNNANTLTSIPHAPTVTPQGTPGATTWRYAIVGIDAAGLRTLISPNGTTTSGAATLTGSNFNRITWAAKPACVTYEVNRMTAGGTPATVGVIGTTALLTFDDTGLATTGPTPPDYPHIDMHHVFP